VAPTHAPDIVIYIDAITIVFEEAGKNASPSSVPIACIEAGNEHSLPNLTLRLAFFLKFLVIILFCIEILPSIFLIKIDRFRYQHFALVQ